MTLTICHLYPELMNTYGDRGNLFALERRAAWRGIRVSVKRVSVNDPLKLGQTDLYLMGGGQDNAQVVVARDLVTKAATLRHDIEAGVVALTVCGGYQLFGRSYTDQQGRVTPGIGIFDITTVAGPTRLVGNLLIEGNGAFAGRQYVGFENHSGQTFLGSGAQPLGRVVRGFGNNSHDGTEGVVYRNAIGTYLHGSLLPNNPWLTDYLITTALSRRYHSVQLTRLNDTFERRAFTEATQR